MEDIEKLRHLIEHWVEHNAGHMKTYLQWAATAEEQDMAELAGILRQIAKQSEKQEELLYRALKAAG